MSSATAESLTLKEAALKSLYDDLYARNMFPFWATSEGVDHDEVRQLMATSKAIPFVWKYTDIEPMLQRAAQLVTMDDSERRSLILVNPGLTPKRASVSTMYTAYRLNDPNEIMPPHKHSPSAIRFGLTGTGNFTGIIAYHPQRMFFGTVCLKPCHTAFHGNRFCIGRNQPSSNRGVINGYNKGQIFCSGIPVMQHVKPV